MEMEAVAELKTPNKRSYAGDVCEQREKRKVEGIITGFIEDLRRVSKDAGEFLREKSRYWNNKEGFTDDLYSSEHEFVAEVYRRLLESDEKAYSMNLFVDYYRPRKKDKTNPNLRPDLVFYDRNGNGTAVEVKTVIRWYENNQAIYAEDLYPIIEDYDKLKEEYSAFQNRVLLVAFLGDPEDYHRNKFAAEVNKLVHGNSSIEVITC